jgi:hypothetical protein
MRRQARIIAAFMRATVPDALGTQPAKIIEGSVAEWTSYGGASLICYLYFVRSKRVRAWYTSHLAAAWLARQGDSQSCDR